MRDGNYTIVRSGALLFLCLVTALAVTLPVTVYAGHRLDAPGTSCNTCHSVGGASDSVVANTRLIKKDARVLEILNGGWSTGQPLPCIYCHDSTSQTIRTNMAGVKDHFSDLSLSKHPVDGFVSNNNNPPGLDCIDCHTNVSYVGGGNALSPNIHNQDVSAVTWTGAGTIDPAATLSNIAGTGVYSVLNSDGNPFCTQQCHDSGHTGYAAQSVFHGFTTASVTLDDVDAGATPAAPTGCVNTAGASNGCHDTHHSDNNITLVTLEKAAGVDVTRSDCGVCHEFDDQGVSSDWSLSGHGMFSTTNNIQCTSCHDPSGPHFDVTGSTPAANPSLLAFAVSYGYVSGLTGLPVTANCVTSNCHAGYAAHSSQDVGCLDCHEVHGEGVSPNIKMMRRTIPGGSQTLQYTTSGQHWDSTTAPGTFSNWLCDNQDCHSGPTAPGPISDIMSTSPANTTPHAGGTGIMGGCDSCHDHTAGSGGSWSSSGCDSCHGAAGDYWPQTVSTNIGDRPDRAGAHEKHLQALSGNNSCDVCHPNGSHSGDQDNDPADVHQDGISTSNFQNFVPATDANATYDSVASTCALVDCHGETVTPDWYTATPIVCSNCHGSGPQGLPSTGLHSLHVNTANATYVDDCNSCHGSSANTGAHPGHWNGATSYGAPMVSYDGTNSTCANNCHSAGNNDWSGTGALDCTDCHSGTFIAGDNSGTGGSNYLPQTGLHTASNALAHDDSFGSGYGCDNCHINPPTASHITGAFEGAIDVAYSFTTTNNVSYVNTSGAYPGCQANCHDDGGDWSRQWIGVVDAVPAASDTAGSGVCANCHGTFVSGWNWNEAINGVDHTDPSSTASQGPGGDGMGAAGYHPDCQICHGWGDAGYNGTWSTGDHGDGLIEMNGPSPTTGAQYADTNGGCYAACHDPAPNVAMDSNSGWTATYGDYGSGDCDSCHTSNGRTHNGAAESSTTHTFHNTNVYVSNACDLCHPHDGAFIPAHANSTVDFGGSYMTTAFNYTTTFSDASCGGAANGCHDADANEWNNENLGADSCVDCHNASGKLLYTGTNATGMTSQVAPASGEHTVHTGNTYVGGCADCHTHNGVSGTVANHIAEGDTTVITFGSAVTNWPGNGSCVNNCHLAADASEWTAGALNCVDCHSQAGKTLNAGGESDMNTTIGPNAGRHDDHMGNFYVPGGCSTCHGHDGEPSVTATTHIAEGNTNIISIANSLTDTASLPDCTNACHDVVPGSAGDWADANPLDCLHCHGSVPVTAIGGGANAPSTGLHDAAVVTNLLAHDDAFDAGYGCESCHVGPAPTGADHTDGTLEDAGTVTYSWAGSVSSYSVANGCAADCHDDAAKWSRKWTGVANASKNGALPGDGVCDNCHGDGMTGAAVDPGVTGWRGGVIPAHQSNWDADGTTGEVLNPSSNHLTCDYCHGWNDADYDNTFGGTPPAHGDGSITLNGPSGTGAEYNSTTWDCAAACHSGAANAGHNLADSGWPVNYGDFGSGDCDVCHALNNRDHLNTGESSAVHNTTHSASSFYIGNCDTCHTHDGSVSPGTGDHATGTVNFNNTNLSSADMDTTADTVVPNCVNTNACHDADATTEWAADDLGGDSCSDCHGEGYLVDQVDNEVGPVTYPPTSGWHATHRAETDLLPNDCNECHGGNATTGDHANHKTGTISYAVHMIGYLAGNGTCLNSCHSGPSDWRDGSPAPVCGECHAEGYIVDEYDDELGPVSYPPTSGWHATHRAETDLLPNDCTECHGANATAGNHVTHMDAGIDYGTHLSLYTTSDGTCTNTCHTAGDWRDGAPAPVCTDCHNDNYIVDEYDLELTAVAYPPISGQHVTHNAVATSYVDDCNDCHGASANSGAHVTHMDAGIDYATSLASYVSTDGTCSNNCHLAGDWRDGAPAPGCTDCHSGTYVGPNPTTGLHAATALTVHDQTLTGGDGVGCEKCHNGPDPTGVDHIDGLLEDGAAATYAWNSTNIAAGYVRATDDCAAACHTDSGTWNREWSGVSDQVWSYTDDPATDPVCGNCHGTFQSWNIIGETSHVNPSSTNDPAELASTAPRNAHTECTLCHGWNDGSGNYQTGTKHENGTVTMNSEVGYQDVDGSCSINCHSAFPSGLTMATNSGWTIDTVLGGAPACGSCHTDGVLTGSASATHSAHLATPGDLISGGPWPDCIACHPDVNYDLGHSGTLQWANVTYSGGETGTCLTTSCHNQGSEQSNNWDSATQLECNDCHYYEATITNNNNNAAHAASLSNRHDSHFDKQLACSNCHEVLPDGDTSHISAGTLVNRSNAAYPEAAMASSITWSAPNCTAGIGGLGCHASAPTNPSWLAAQGSLACTDCHTTQAASNGYDPYTGIHYQDAGFPAVDGHDGSFGSGYGCESCHIDPATDAHATGTLNTPATASFSWTTANGLTVSTNAAANTADDTCVATCHADNGDWDRKWSGDAYSTSQAVGADRCDVCHGDGTGTLATWNGLGTSHTADPDGNNGTEIMANHSSGSICGVCHGLLVTGEASSYNFTNDHEDNFLEMNGPTGQNGSAGYNSGTGLCDAACHSGPANVNHDMTDSGFDIEFGQYGSGTCDSCHGGSGLYYPQTASVQTTDYPDRIGEHAAHIAALEAQLSYSAGTTVDAEQKSMCIYCHNDSDTEAGQGGHNDNVPPADLGNFNRIWDGTADGGIAAVYTPGNGTDGNCAGIDCHAEGTTPADSQWYDGGSTDCTMCHNDGTDSGTLNNADPGSGRHAVHLASDVYVPQDCTTCHGANANAGTHTGHRSGGPSYGTSLTSYTAPDCVNACHDVVPGSAGDWLDANPLECTHCHGTVPVTAIGGGANAPSTGLHVTTNLTDHNQTLSGGDGVGCEKCHNGPDPTGVDHIDGVLEDGAAATYAWNSTNIAAGYVRATDDCAAACHTDSGTWNREWSGVSDQAINYTDDPSTDPVCGNCHGTFQSWNIIGETSHVNPSSTNDPAQLGSPAPRNAHTECTLCHGWDDAGSNYQTGTKHENTTITMNSDVGYVNTDGSCTLNCHSAFPSGLTMNTNSGWTIDYVAGGAPACGSCHTDGVQTGSASATHIVHNATQADLVSGGPWPDCIACHPDVDYDLGHSGALQFANVTYSGGETGTCLTSSCHNRDTGSLQSTAWDSATSLDCDDCHYWNASPSAATNGAHASSLSNDHGNHFDAAGSYYCTDCHQGTLPSDTSHIDGGGSTLADRATALPNEAQVLVSTWNDTNNTCGNAACHNPSSGASYAATWQTSTAGCTLCHSDNDPGTGDHTKHLNASGTFGINTIGCTTCHPDNTGNDDHLDGTKDVNFTFVQATGCGTNLCHNNGVDQSTGTPRTSTYAWDNAASITDCDECHGDDAASMLSNAHDEHLQYQTPLCTECHTAANVATHINGTVNFGGPVTYGETATVGNGTYSDCTTSNCHNQATATSAVWDTTGQLACDACHYYDASGAAVNSVDNGNHFDPLSTMHNAHFDKDKYCTSCHGAIPGSTTHIDNRSSIAMTDGAVAETDEANVTGSFTWADAGNTCGSFTGNGLGCHATGSADWDLSTSADDCVECHTNTTNTNVNPTSGLHGSNATSMISANPHDGAFAATIGDSGDTAGCVDCHTATPTSPATEHQNGTFSNDNPTVNLDTTGLGFTDGTPPTCAANTCHIDGTANRTGTAVSGAWLRLWSDTVDDTATTPDPRCNNCHGTFWTGQSFRGNVLHLNTANMRSIHTTAGNTTDDCIICHGYGDAAYDSVGYGPASADHGDVQITINDDGGGTYTGWQRGTGGNSNSSTCAKCHGFGDAPDHDFDKTFENFSEVAATVVTAACGSCHSDGVTPSYASTTHAAHGATIGELVDSLASWPACNPCHPDVDYDGGHSGALQFANVTYGGGENGSCTTTNCHNQGTEVSNTWDNTTQLECNDCHYYEATITDNTNNAAHAASLSNRHDSHFDKQLACSNCHTVPGAGDTAHINGATDLVDMSNAAYPEAAITGPTWSAPNCTAGIGGLGCHASAPTNPSWLAASLNCTDCHTPQASSNGFDPYTGLHYQNGSFPATEAHDGSFGTGDGCTSCHQDPASNAHATGTLNTPATASFSWSSANGLTVSTNAAANTTDDTCVAQCHSEYINAGSKTWQRQWNKAAYSTNTTPGNARCAVCHGDFANGWNTGFSPSHNLAALTATGNHGTCTTCHNIGDTAYTWGTHHENDNITMNSDPKVNYNAANNWCTGGVCHGATTSYDMPPDSGWTVQLVDGPTATCRGCHAVGNSVNAPAVTHTSDHIDPDGASGSTYQPSGWDANTNFCVYCHDGHYAATNGVQIPNPPVFNSIALTTSLGIHYTLSGHGGIAIGGTSTDIVAAIRSVTTEAGICWGCHDNLANPTVSEWGTNNNTTTGGLSYNYGTLWTTLTGGSQRSAWNGAYWRSPETDFAYKNEQIQSTHSANPTSGSSTLSGTDYNRTESPDADSTIRCSYCHDVHNTAGAMGASNDPSGEPYLRGWYKGNPYKEDGAPRDGQSWTDTGLYESVPRASAASTNSLGGFWIDQNSGDPNSSATAASTAGLCSKCHDATAPGTAANWVSGYDGHENVIIGGSGRGNNASAESEERNIFNRTWRGSGDIWNDEEAQPNAEVDMGLVNVASSSDRGHSFRTANSDGYQLYPRLNNGSTRPYAFRDFEWNNMTGAVNIATGTVQLQVSEWATNTYALSCKDMPAGCPTTEPYDSANDRPDYDAQANYHTFNCAKCHNPHASRLPKLMQTNCLDTSHNNWDENIQADTSDQFTVGTTPWDNTYASQWPSAQNCHRLDERGSDATPDTSLGRGWNKVTPW